ncbi:hypothetical protein [Paenibacillus sp. HB172176]|uniref:hypothetical protein n=1 Tax=Paenibacillus sp. HB172176 TaxID=2493690 RepID=UPI001F0FD9CA|nr:hypothetical protein [Paenibacillus sp. HB172176]
MTDSSAILFEFVDERSAKLANDMLQELGYESVMHSSTRMHIHVEGCDLTSALEIALSHGGQLVEQASIAMNAIANSAYAMDAITIPAHVVNEDWIDQEEEAEAADLHNRDDDAEYESEFLPDSETYNHFSGDVHT